MASTYDPNIPHIDTGLKAMIDAKIDSDVDGTKYYRNTWNISRSEYKAWIALIALQESGNFGYGAHSGTSTDSYQHLSGKNFYFSTGLGAFQLDRGGNGWSTMPSIDKLDPEKSLESTLTFFYNTYKGTEDLSVFESKSKWYGVATKNEAVFAPIWQSMTAHTWNECKNTKLDVNFNPATFDAPYSNYVTYIGKIHWNPHNGMFDKDLDTWLITANSYRATNGHKYQYYYTYDGTTGWESWVLNDAEKKYVYRFDRNYASTYLPNPLYGITTSYPAFDLRKKLDLIFLVDTTGSMGDDIASVKSSASNIVEALDSKSLDYRVCLADYRDYPMYPYGVPGIDYDYHLDQAFSSNKDEIIKSINSLTLGNGYDWQESVYSALVKAMEDKDKDSSRSDNYGWRKGATKCIIVMGDAPPHNPEPWSGGHSLNDVVSLSKSIDPVAVYSITIGSDSTTYSEFSKISEMTDGKVYTTDDAEGLVDTIIEAIKDIEPAEPERSVSVNVNPSNSVVNPGGSATYSISVTNTGKIADTYDMSLDLQNFASAYRGYPTAVQKSWINSDIALVEIEPGATKTVSLTISIPNNWAGMEDVVYPFDVIAKSETDESISNTSSAELKITANKKSTVEYSKLETIWLSELIKSSSIDNGIKNSLLDKLTNTTLKLDQSISNIESGKDKQANNMLDASQNIINAFINQVNAQYDKKIMQPDANMLAQKANEISKDINISKNK